MRKKHEKKRGALSIEQAKEKATELIAEHGTCLFIVDIVQSRSYEGEAAQELFQSFASFLQEVSEKYEEYLPVNELAVGPSRPEKGFQEHLGDASWAGINNAEVVSLIAEFKDEHYPELPLHYGVAKDGWSEGIELAK